MTYTNNLDSGRGATQLKGLLQVSPFFSNVNNFNFVHFSYINWSIKWQQYKKLKTRKALLIEQSSEMVFICSLPLGHELARLENEKIERTIGRISLFIIKAGWI